MSNDTVKTVDLEKIRDDYKAAAARIQRRIIICAGTGCVANGSLEVRDALAEALKEAGVDVALELKKEEEHTGTYISKSGCQGFCQMGPLLHIEPGDILYTKVKVSDVPEIVERTLKKGEVIDRLLFVHPQTHVHCKGDAEIPFYNRQKRVVLANCRVEPSCVREYIARGGYFGARKAILEMKPEEVCQTAIDSGLRGRGGGGFPTGLKWKFTLASQNDKKYVICNGDEGDPGAFMDRSVMEGNPHSVIEGMMIAARAIGADEGYVYVRAEYPLAVERMRAAVKDAEEAGLLGDHLFGSDFSFKVTVMEGAGAFVCGEETALIASIEGKRGMPRPKPPFPAQSGLWGKPTVINNVETLASVPGIFLNGPEQYKAVGTEKSPGTKTFALTGHVANTGLIEVPFGTTLREIIYNIGGGVTNNKGEVTTEDFKAVQIGGPSGGCLTPDRSPASSCSSPRMNPAASAFPAAKAPSRCSRCSTTSSRAAPTARPSNCSKRPPRRSSSVRCARSARPRRTRCCRRCASSARSMKRTCSRKSARSASARRWPVPKSSLRSAKAVPPAPGSARSARSPAKSRKST